jgi:hypothetical protein
LIARACDLSPTVEFVNERAALPAWITFGRPTAPRQVATPVGQERILGILTLEFPQWSDRHQFNSCT